MGRAHTGTDHELVLLGLRRVARAGGAAGGPVGRQVPPGARRLRLRSLHPAHPHGDRHVRLGLLSGHQNRHGTGSGMRESYVSVAVHLK